MSMNASKMQYASSSSIHLSASDRKQLEQIIVITNTGFNAFILHLECVSFVLQSEQDREASGSRVYPNDTSLALPVGEVKGRLVMDANTFIYNNTRPADFSRYFEVNASVYS